MVSMSVGSQPTSCAASASVFMSFPTIHDAAIDAESAQFLPEFLDANGGHARPRAGL
jgi:hypothetical protein